MKKQKRKISFSLKQKMMSGGVLLSFCLSTQAALVVVGDYGGQSARPFYDAINNASNEVETQAPVTLPIPSVATPAMVLPVRTPEMTPERFASRAVSLPGIGALYLVGDDPLSREWLEQHARKLNAMHAVGMVVNVDSAVALQELRELTDGGILSPMSASDLANRLQLTHYPVLITETELTQQVK